MNKPPFIALWVLAFCAFMAFQMFYIVDQRAEALVLQLGQPRGEPRGPGLHVKIPFIQNVVFFDRRVLSVDPPPDQMVIASSSIPQEPLETEGERDQGTAGSKIPREAPAIQNVSGEPIIVDTFARYKISNSLQFLKTLRTVGGANSRLETILNDATRAVLGRTTLKELLSSERSRIMETIKTRVNQKIKQDQLGITLVDVRIVRADLTSDLRSSTVRRMISELKERATETRAKGEEHALEIRSTADKERTIAIAQAQQNAQALKGKGDMEAIKIYATAFNKDPAFYSFIRSMEAYKTTLSDPQTRLILSPESPFFKHFNGQ